MSTKSTISISFKIEDGVNGLKTMTVDANSLKTALSATVKAADDLKKPFINFASISTGVTAVQSVIQNIQSALKGLTDAYSVQIQAETQLENSMRNTMSATDSEIQSIKDLCSAQQQLGVIGDEVQLAGAQKLATFLSEKNSLEALIPVMNHLSFNIINAWNNKKCGTKISLFAFFWLTLHIKYISIGIDTTQWVKL